MSAPEAVPTGAPAPVRFLITCPARTGSSMLTSFLQSHPDICMHGEVFGRGAPLAFFGLDYSRGAPPLEDVLRRIRNRSPVRFLTKFVFYAGAYRAVGLKLKYEELLRPEYGELMHHLGDDTEIKIVHLRRENLLERFLSQHVAVKVTKVYNISDEADRPADPGPVYLPIDECEDDFARTERRQARFHDCFAGHDAIEVTYEQLVASREVTLRRVQEFLGLEPRPLETIHKRLRNRSLGDSIENWDELRLHFATTRFARFFEGPTDGDS